MTRELEPPYADGARPAYLVLGRDVPDAEDGLLRQAEAHWDYIDRFPALLARGPLLSPDGSTHLGSVHVIAAASSAQAWRFADGEPYRQAGLYASITVAVRPPRARLRPSGR